MLNQSTSRLNQTVRLARHRVGCGTPRLSGGVNPALRSRLAGRVQPLLLLACALLLAGCGYQGGSGSTGYKWRSLYRQDVQSVAVPIFTNRSFERGVEFRLTKALVSQLEATTPYKVMPRERADTILEGEIVSATVNPMSHDRRTNLPQEQLLLLRVNFTWKDLRTGRILVQQKDFEQATTYYPTLGEGQFVGTQHAVDNLAVGIVQALASDW